MFDLRRAQPADREGMFGVWLRAVRATHSFVAAADVEAMIPQVRDYLATDSEFWVVATTRIAVPDQTRARDEVLAFMGMSGNKMDSLFVAPEAHRQGIGRRLVCHAKDLHGAALMVDVNEQNAEARRFYEACGFIIVGRSPLDDQGRPYPLLHMRMGPPTPTSPG